MESLGSLDMNDLDEIRTSISKLTPSEVRRAMIQTRIPELGYNVHDLYINDFLDLVIEDQSGQVQLDLLNHLRSVLNNTDSLPLRDTEENRMRVVIEDDVVERSEVNPSASNCASDSQHAFATGLLANLDRCEGSSSAHKEQGSTFRNVAFTPPAETIQHADDGFPTDEILLPDLEESETFENGNDSPQTSPAPGPPPGNYLYQNMTSSDANEDRCSTDSCITGFADEGVPYLTRSNRCPSVISEVDLTEDVASMKAVYTESQLRLAQDESATAYTGDDSAVEYTRCKSLAPTHLSGKEHEPFYLHTGDSSATAPTESGRNTRGDTPGSDRNEKSHHYEDTTNIRLHPRIDHELTSALATGLTTPEQRKRALEKNRALDDDDDEGLFPIASANNGQPISSAHTGSPICAYDNDAHATYSTPTRGFNKEFTTPVSTGLPELFTTSDKAVRRHDENTMIAGNRTPSPVPTSEHRGEGPVLAARHDLRDSHAYGLPTPTSVNKRKHDGLPEITYENEIQDLEPGNGWDSASRFESPTPRGPTQLTTSATFTQVVQLANTRDGDPYRMPHANYEADPEDVQLLGKATRVMNRLEGLHLGYLGRMRDLYVEVKGLKEEIRSLRREFERQFDAQEEAFDEFRRRTLRKERETDAKIDAIRAESMRKRQKLA